MSKQNGNKGRRFDRAFKKEAVRLLQTSGRRQRQIAGDLGISVSALGRWVAELREEDLLDSTVKRPERQVAGHASAHGPADDAPGVEVEHDGQVQPALCRPDIADVGVATRFRQVALGQTDRAVVLAGRHVQHHQVGRYVTCDEIAELDRFIVPLVEELAPSLLSRQRADQGWQLPSPNFRPTFPAEIPRNALPLDNAFNVLSAIALQNVSPGNQRKFMRLLDESKLAAHEIDRTAIGSR